MSLDLITIILIGPKTIPDNRVRGALKRDKWLQNLGEKLQKIVHLMDELSEDWDLRNHEWWMTQEYDTQVMLDQIFGHVNGCWLEVSHQLLRYKTEFINDFVRLWNHHEYAPDWDDRLYQDKRICVAGESTHGGEPTGHGFSTMKVITMFRLHRPMGVE